MSVGQRRGNGTFAMRKYAKVTRENGFLLSTEFYFLLMYAAKLQNKDEVNRAYS